MIAQIGLKKLDWLCIIRRECFVYIKFFLAFIPLFIKRKGHMVCCPLQSRKKRTIWFYRGEHRMSFEKTNRYTQQWHSSKIKDSP